ncbi:MAG: hydrolase [Armatimonadota bacterium]
MPRMVARVKELAAESVEMYLWSSGGSVYAREVAEQLGIAQLFKGFLPKPTLLVDDQHPSEWRYLHHELPYSV